MAFAKSAVLLSLAVVVVSIAFHCNAETNTGGILTDVLEVLKAFLLPTSSSTAAANTEEVLSLQGTPCGMQKFCPCSLGHHHAWTA
jgi:hypothetical protein